MREQFKFSKQFIVKTSLFLFILLVFWVSIGADLIYSDSQQNDGDVHASQNIIAPATADSVKDIQIVTPLQGGIVKNVFVSVGDKVAKNTPLFSLEDSHAQNALTMQKLNADSAKVNLQSQQHQLERARQRYEDVKNLDKRAISRAEVQDRAHAVLMAEAQLKQAETNLSLAMASLKNAELNLNEFTIRAPKDAVVLQIDVQPDQLVFAGNQLMLLGDANKVFVRVQIDERDVSRFRNSAAAFITSLDGNALKIPVKFLRRDRYVVVPEHVNSRLQEIVYYFNRAEHPAVAAGQQFDATITLASGE